MSNFSKNQTSNPIQTELFIGLSHFGLNPFDWNFELINNHTVLIKNKEISDLCFKGIVRKDQGRYKWLHISLQNL